MSNIPRAWLPQGLPPSLAVPTDQQPLTQSLYRDLLESHLQQLIDADVPAARAAMQMSQEHAPGLWSIAQQHPTTAWAALLVRSDQTTSLLAESSNRGQQIPDPQASLSEMLEALA